MLTPSLTFELAWSTWLRAEKLALVRANEYMFAALVARVMDIPSEASLAQGLTLVTTLELIVKNELTFFLKNNQKAEKRAESKMHGLYFENNMYIQESHFIKKFILLKNGV